MKAGARVVHRQHPEYGYGTIKYEEENVLGERRLQVTFDYLDTLVELTSEQVEVVGSPEEDALAGNWGTLPTLQRRLLAALIVGENNTTSAFIKTTTRPLPHQVSVLDKILSGERFGHLCADDVGLGKTIEAGLLITSILTGPRSKRILIVCPAGVALQWQDEMEEHFSLYFAVLGIDFRGAAANQWRNHPLIIAPIDRLKQPRFEAILRDAGPFDLVVCDEAHRLNASRNRLTQELQKTKGYRLFERLVADKTIDFVSAAGAPRSPRLVFLSATPHQGDDIRFLYLLNLIRPDLFPIEGEDVSLLQSERLREAVTRTPKALARDWEGKPIFKGHTSQTLDVPWTVDETAISRLLSSYIRQSLSGSAATGRPNPLVVELVMHTFHKIAASSWRALRTTLEQRLRMLEGRQNIFTKNVGLDEEPDQEFEISSDGFEKAFFDQEAKLLREILAALHELPKDNKWERCRELLLALDGEQAGCKVLFFTQFRSTQDYLREQLLKLFAGSGVEIVNGDVPLLERRLARKRFESASRFMVSTEAGGEGVNLQRACHIMVNYDLAWNPMRMQQRIGRLDRYGQLKRVSVFNLRVPESWDTRISTRIEERLEVIQRTMGQVVAADIENYREMILGQVADKIDPTSAFKEHLHGRDISVEDVDRFLKEAIESMERWKTRVGDGLAPEVDTSKFRPTLTANQFRQSYAAALGGLDLTLQESRNSQNQFLQGVYHFPLPVEFRDPQIRAGREFYAVFDREVFQKARDEDLGSVKGQPIRVNLAGFGESFTDWLFQDATAARIGPSAFRLRAPASWAHGSGWIAVYTLRFLGASRRISAPDALSGVFVGPDGVARSVAADEVFSLCVAAQESLRFVGAPPDLASTLNVARQELRQRVGARAKHATTSMWLSPWLLIAVDAGRAVEANPNISKTYATFRQSLGGAAELIGIADALWGRLQSNPDKRLTLDDLAEVGKNMGVSINDVLGVIGLLSAPSASLIALELRSEWDDQVVAIKDFGAQLGSWWREKRISEEDWRGWARGVKVSWTAADEKGAGQ